MSSVVVITPVVIASWPVISAAVTAAIGSMGFAVAKSAMSTGVAKRVDSSNKTEITIDESEILSQSVTGETMVVERDGVTATFSRDHRGALKLCMEGPRLTKSQLQQIGQELIDRVTQQYVYHKVVTELKERHMNIVDEEVSADRTVTIRVRNL